MINLNIVSASIKKFIKENISYNDASYNEINDGQTLKFKFFNFVYLFKLYLGPKAKIIMSYNSKELALKVIFDEHKSEEINFDILSEIVKESTSQEYFDVNITKYGPYSPNLIIDLAIPNECFDL